jgi:hypothetical protein
MRGTLIGGRLTIEGNNFVGSLLKSLLKKAIPIVGSRMLRTI